MSGHEGSDVRAVAGTQVALHEGEAVLVPAGAEHRFGAYQHLSVLLVFDRSR